MMTRAGDANLIKRGKEKVKAIFGTKPSVETPVDKPSK